MGRLRTRNKYYSGSYRYTNSYYNPPSEEEGPVTASFTETVEDDVHKPPYVAEGPLKVVSFSGGPARVSGYKRSGTHRVWLFNAPLHCGMGDYTDVWSFPTQGWLNEAIASIQDTAPEMDLPLIIAELKDIPRSLRSLQNLLKRDGVRMEDLNDLYLATQYAGRPVVSDMLKLLGLQRSISERVRRHRRKHRTRRASGKLSESAIFDWTAWLPTDGSTPMPHAGVIPASNQYEVDHKAWWSARLEPALDLPETLAAVLDNPFGVGRLSAETAWNLIPFSFLIDYFADVSDVLRATDNVMPYTIKSICLMCETEQTCICTPSKPSGFTTWSQSTGRKTVTTKNRWVHLSPTSRLALTPFLSTGQLANIVSLAVALKGYR